MSSAGVAVLVVLMALPFLGHSTDPHVERRVRPRRRAFLMPDLGGSLTLGPFHISLGSKPVQQQDINEVASEVQAPPNAQGGMGAPPMGMQAGMAVLPMGMQAGMAVPPMGMQAGMAVPPMGMQAGIAVPPMGMQAGMAVPPMGMQAGMGPPPMGMQAGMGPPPMGMQAGMAGPPMGMHAGMGRSGMRVPPQARTRLPGMPGAQPPAQEPAGVYQGPLPDVVSLMTKLHYSVILRENLVAVFGYLINRPNVAMTLDLYASLYDLYMAARLRRVRTMELLHLLSTMSSEDPHKQCLLLFRELPKVTPRYLLGAVQTWNEALTQKKIDMNELLRDPTVSFLEDIDASVLPLLSRPTAFAEASTRLSPRDVSARMGIIFGSIFGSILDGSLQVSQPLVAYLLKHVQLSGYAPDEDEARDYLQDVLVEQRPELEFAVQNLSAVDTREPYSLLTAVLARLADNPGGDVYVTETAALVLPSLGTPDLGVYNAHYAAMSPLVSGTQIPLSQLFKLITQGEFPDDIVVAKEHLLQAILKKELDVDAALRGFNRFEYTQPFDLLVAVVDRVRRRVLLEGRLDDTMQAINAHLKLKYCAVYNKPRASQGFGDLVLSFDGFRNPVLADDVRQLSREVLSDLREEALDWGQELAAFGCDAYSQPRDLVVALLDSLLQRQKLARPEGVTRFLEAVRRARGCPGAAPPPIQTVTLEKLLPALELGATEDPERMRVLTAFLMGPNLTAALGSDFQPSQFPTTGMMLSAILARSMHSPLVRESPELYDSVSFFHERVQTDGYGAQPVDGDTSEKMVDMARVLAALQPGEEASLRNVVAFLQSEFHKDNLRDGFHIQAYRTRGQFLAGLFSHLLRNEDVPAPVKADLKALLPLVQHAGPGAEPIDFTDSE